MKHRTDTKFPTGASHFHNRLKSFLALHHKLQYFSQVEDPAKCPKDSFVKNTPSPREVAGGFNEINRGSEPHLSFKIANLKAQHFALGCSEGTWDSHSNQPFFFRVGSFKTSLISLISRRYDFDSPSSSKFS